MDVVAAAARRKLAEKGTAMLTQREIWYCIERSGIKASDPRDPVLQRRIAALEAKHPEGLTPAERTRLLVCPS